ncbi:hypothetical protein ACQKPE_11005 [Pseudomonas sp. NPDC089554]|uniref:hypothetical protein n=1 Tax=Pseudomonas sp. NPDC089554 TaxID=3390653 RepID=UPI003CFEDA96
MKTVIAALAAAGALSTLLALADGSGKMSTQVVEKTTAERKPLDEQATHRSTEPPTHRAQARGMGPVVGMVCENGYKQIGDDCVYANTEFE